MNMPDVTKIIVCGCHGRLGAAICEAVIEASSAESNPAAQSPSGGIHLVAGVDTVQKKGLTLDLFHTDITQVTAPAHVVIICLPPNADAAVIAQLQYCAARRIPAVLCTTAFPDSVQAQIEKTARQTAVLVSANLSLGVNLLAAFIKKTAALLHEAGFDIEIVERHHNQKLDAPSGTAFLLADAANSALGGDMQYVTARPGKAARPRNEIGIHALRGGTITGEHTVVFAGQDEVIELSHSARSRRIFAAGAIKAAHFIKSKPPGVYSMGDLIEV